MIEEELHDARTRQGWERVPSAVVALEGEMPCHGELIEVLLARRLEVEDEHVVRAAVQDHRREEVRRVGEHARSAARERRDAREVRRTRKARIRREEGAGAETEHVDVPRIDADLRLGAPDDVVHQLVVGVDVRVVDPREDAHVVVHRRDEHAAGVRQLLHAGVRERTQRLRRRARGAVEIEDDRAILRGCGSVVDVDLDRAIDAARVDRRHPGVKLRAARGRRGQGRRLAAARARRTGTGTAGPALTAGPLRASGAAVSRIATAAGQGRQGEQNGRHDGG